MKRNTSIWASVSLLIGVVIAVLALVRGPWLIPLLLCVFAAWSLWLFSTQVSFFQQTKRLRTQAAGFDRTLAQTLLRHVNYRVSDRLQASYPNARWEWMMRDPALFIAQGGTGRIRVYGVTDYDFADVTVDQDGRLSCSLVKLSPMEGAAEKPVPPNEQPADPQVWYDTQGRETLERLAADLESRGYGGLTLKENGSICIRVDADTEEMSPLTFASFPAKDTWPELAEIFRKAGLSTAVQDDCIVLNW